MYIALTATLALACGGYCDDPSIVNSSDEEFLHIPSANFAEEIRRIPLPKTRFKPGDGSRLIRNHDDANLSAERADLRRALAAQGIDERWIRELQDLVTAIRKDALKHGQMLVAWRSEQSYEQTRGNPAPQPPVIAYFLPASATRGQAPALPAEFRQYLLGWVALQWGDADIARTHFQAVLDLPADRRQYRSVWAAFMIGRSYQQSDPKKAIEWFIKTRDLVQADHHDTLGLAAASFGWQARACLDLGEYDNAINLYLLQLSAGDPTAVQSLQRTAAKALEAGDDILRKLAANASHRTVLTAYIVAMGGPWQPTPDEARVVAWLNAVESAGAKTVDAADRLAWSAYQYGHYDLAQRWADRADQKLPIVQWVQAKLLLRRGQVDPAMKLLASAVRGEVPARLKMHGWANAESADRGNRLQGELGALYLTKGQYAEALELLINAGYWDDAAHIAERVLTADELQAEVDRRFPAEMDRPDVYVPIRQLLARRLLRLGRWKDARPYYRLEEQKKLDEYIAALRRGYDLTLPRRDRGLALFAAARSMRSHGMQLAGTELGPDVSMRGGGTELAPRAARTSKLLPTSPDELQRLARPPEQLERRFQYRYLAADHAWAAAGLLPDGSDDLADVLNTAGGWLKARDPIAAQRYYDALVKRCPNTAIGKKAIERKWFVPVKN